jgi:TAG lipase/steryl ester hydrolase/phospholipase A2/LPA acyltransferase
VWNARQQLRTVYAALDAANTYAEWRAAAEAHDRLTGAEAWRRDDASPFYDAAGLRASCDRLRSLRNDPVRLAEVLTDDLNRHQASVSATDLYTTAMAGTKHLIDEWLDVAEASLRILAEPQPNIPIALVRSRFKAAYAVYGRTALLLSGGATLGFHHLGVVKAMFELDLLPHVISGASTGAMIAAGVCARTDTELRAMFDNLDELRLDGLLPVGPREALRTRAVLDPARLHEVLRHNVGDATFDDAWRHSGRTLVISVSPTQTRQKPRILCHLTTPDVYVASAALASSALPGLFPPVVLQRRGPTGPTPYLPGETWVDGSIYGDLPMRRLSRLFNVNHFVVSQTNPHVLPFVRHHGRSGFGPAVSGLVSATIRTQSTYATDVTRRLVPETAAPARGIANSLHALVSQDYRGDIDIHPEFHWRLYRKVVANPTRDDLRDFVREGERSVWPRVAMIRAQTRLGRAFHECVHRLGD